jgi:hypothetical protein
MSADRTKAERERDVREWDRLGFVCSRYCLPSGALGLAGLACAAWSALEEVAGRRRNPFWYQATIPQVAVWAAVGVLNALLLADPARWLFCKRPVSERGQT